MLLPGLAALVLLIIAAVMIFRPVDKAQPARLPAISQSALEERYGLRVTLVAVTAAGGMVDVRLKMLDGAKAQTLLQAKEHFPALWIEDRQITLQVSEEIKSQEIKFEDGGDLFLLFPNSGGAVKAGTPVTLMFGDTPLEPIEAR